MVQLQYVALLLCYVYKYKHSNWSAASIIFHAIIPQCQHRHPIWMSTMINIYLLFTSAYYMFPSYKSAMDFDGWASKGNVLCWILLDSWHWCLTTSGFYEVSIKQNKKSSSLCTRLCDYDNTHQIVLCDRYSIYSLQLYQNRPTTE